MISQETGLRGSAQNYGGMTKRRHHMWGKGPFGRENAELKNSPLKRRDGCSMTRSMSDCNYPSFYLAIRMRIRDSKTHYWTDREREKVERGLSVMGIACIQGGCL